MNNSKASGEGRGRSRCALPLLFPLLLFSSFSFGASSLSGYVPAGGSGCYSLSTAGDLACSSQCSGGSFVSSYSSDQVLCSTSCYAVVYSCLSSCSVPSGEPVGEIGSSLTPNANGVLPNTFCDPTSNCDTESFSSSAGFGGSMTNGQACFVTSPTSSTSSSSSSCPSGYSLADSSGCLCSNGSSFVSSNSAATNPSCNGGSSTASTLSPVAPVTSNGVTSCPAGSASVSSGSSTSCYTVVVPPATNSGASGTASGGSGGGSSFHVVAPVTSSNGQLTCQPGQSSIMGSSGSLECIASGSGTAPTSSTGSGTAPTGSTSSAPSYPSSISMPSLPGVSVVTTALASIPGAQETSSEQCPAPVTFTVMGHTFSITFSYACTLAGQVRPVVIGVFSLASLLLIVK
ncbi:virulence factor TspB C-terminal domain-related protein [Acidithiobacillus sp.]|uniref:virulence factor TspB C-terminal domain-related protein n=1 Tax=Acidithiobacillus sp. TaxID=1872118 RepID=UPI00304EE1D8|nr:hypothetical protein [Candidatus Neomarinimicrobiota bacterium]